MKWHYAKPGITPRESGSLLSSCGLRLADGTPEGEAFTDDRKRVDCEHCLMMIQYADCLKQKDKIER